MRPPRGPNRITRVLHILGELNPSGMERMLVSGAPYFKEQHCESLVVGQGVFHPFLGELVTAGYEVRIMQSPLRSWRGQKELRNLIRSERIDAVHIHTESNYLLTTVITAQALRGAGTIVRTIHNVFKPRGLRFLSRWIQALIADRLIDNLVAPSPDVAINEHRFLRSPKVIYNWVDDRLFDIAIRRQENLTPLTRDRPLVALIIGNCSAIKRHELAARAVLAARHNLIHVGSELNIGGEEAAILSKLEANMQLQGRGAQAPDSALFEADYFLMSSTNEGMSVALAEALVAGLPCYISDAPGLRWATVFPSVTVIPANQKDWNERLSEHTLESNQTICLPGTIDFHAKRGVDEYVISYRNNEREELGT
jgi:glycosyltransferase involved in cell wall biosynthesis